MSCSMAVSKHAAAALVLLLLVAHTAIAPPPGQGARMTNGSFRQFRADANGPMAVAGDVSTSAVKPADAVAVAAAGPSVNTQNSFDLCYNLNVNTTLAFADVAYWQGRYLTNKEFIADTTCYLQWLPVREVTYRGVRTALTCDCLDPTKCGGRNSTQPCCKNMMQWRAARDWAITSSYVWRSDAQTSDLGDGYVCEWIQTRPLVGFGIMVASVSYSVVALA